MRTPHPAIAESLSGEFEREAREAPLRARITELEGKLATMWTALRRAEEYHLEPRRAVEQCDAGFFECDICYERGGNDLPPIRHSASVVLTTGETGCPFAVLSDSDPTAQALARLVEAVGVEVQAEDEEPDPADIPVTPLLLSRIARRAAYTAYEAARSGRGEGG